MDLRGEERTFIDFADNSFLVTETKDFSDVLFLSGKDIMLEAKFNRLNQ